MVIDSLNLANICEELGSVKHRLFQIGIQLGIPYEDMKILEKDSDPLSAVIDYWLRGNVKGASVSWKSLVKALKSSHVAERGQAKRIEEKYCQEKGVLSDDGGKSNNH